MGNRESKRGKVEEVAAGSLVVAAMVAVMTAPLVPALVQADGTDESKLVAQTEKEKKEKEKKEKAKEEEKEITEVPSSGGISIGGAALLGLRTGALIVGAGLVTFRIVREQ